jgi:hypothetical protein
MLRSMTYLSHILKYIFCDILNTYFSNTIPISEMFSKMFFRKKIPTRFRKNTYLNGILLAYKLYSFLYRNRYNSGLRFSIQFRMMAPKNVNPLVNFSRNTLKPTRKLRLIYLCISLPTQFFHVFRKMGMIY